MSYLKETYIHIVIRCENNLKFELFELNICQIKSIVLWGRFKKIFLINKNVFFFSNCKQGNHKYQQFKIIDISGLNYWHQFYF